MLKRNLQKLINDSQESIARLQVQAADELKALVSLEQVCEAVVVEYAAQEAIVLNADVAFRTAVENQHQGCDFLGTIAAVGAIVACAASVYGAVAGAAIALGEAAKKARTTPRTWKNDKLIANDLVDAGTNLGTLQTKWNELKDLVTPDHKEIAKLVMAKEDVDKITEPYLELAEANNLREEVQHFLDLGQSKNDLIMAYTQKAAAYADTLASIDDRQAEISRVQIELAVSNRTINFENTYTALARYAFIIRTALIKFLYQQHLSFQYWSLSRREFTLASDSPEALRARDTATRANIIDAF